jgi:hypothetical protein
MHRIIFGEIFIFISLHILTGGDMNSLCWLAENDIIIRGETN